MNDPLKYPHWQLPVRDAVLEFNARRLSAKVRSAERAIQQRLHALTSETHDFQERQALRDALATLEILKQERKRRAT